MGFSFDVLFTQGFEECASLYCNVSGVCQASFVPPISGTNCTFNGTASAGVSFCSLDRIYLGYACISWDMLVYPSWDRFVYPGIS